MQNTSSISARLLSQQRDLLTVLDVRKPLARAASGFEIMQSQFHHPFDAANWAADYASHQLVIYCVHGHEVSQAVSGFLRDAGIDCRYLEGGFEAWRQAGFEVMPINDRDLA